MSLVIRPIALRAANEFVVRHHRHLKKPARGCVFCVSVWKDGELCGVAIFGRPARMLQDGLTGVITRCCTDGTPNACSKLYATVAKAARTLGYERIITYTLPEEGGASLKAAGWTCEGDGFGGGTWSREGRERIDEHPLQPKLRWAA